MATAPPKKARKLLAKARIALTQAGKKARRAAQGRKPKLSPACAILVRNTTKRVAAGIK